MAAVNRCIIRGVSSVGVYAPNDARQAVAYAFLDMPLMKYEIVCFCTLMKKLSLGAVDNTSPSFRYNKVFCPRAEINFLPLIIIFLPSL